MYVYVSACECCASLCVRVCAVLGNCVSVFVVTCVCVCVCGVMNERQALYFGTIRDCYESFVIYWSAALRRAVFVFV